MATTTNWDGAEHDWGQGLGPRVGAEGEEGLGVEGRISISTTTVLPAGASKLKSRDAAAATGGLHDSPRRHATAPTTAAATTAAIATATGPLGTSPRRSKQRVALPPPRRRRRGWFELHADDDRQPPSAETRSRRDRSEVRATKPQQLQQPAIYHPTAG